MKIVIVSGRWSQNVRNSINNLQQNGIYVFNEPPNVESFMVTLEQGLLKLRTAPAVVIPVPFGSMPLENDEECLVLVHRTCAQLRDAIPHKSVDKWSEFLSEKVKVYAFSHDRRSNIYVTLEKELVESDVNATSLWNAIQEAIRKGEEELTKEKVIPEFSALKHRIAHCFLSIDVDLQGILTTWDEDEEEAKEYLAGVLWRDEGKSSKPSGYYVGELEKSRRLAGFEGNESDTIQKIVQGQDLQENEWWMCAKKLFGGYSANDGTSSPIYPLLRSLDDQLDEGGNKSRDEQLTL